MAAAPQRRFPNFVYGRGEEPDARFSLANERTFLTWITAGLALLSAGVALHAFLPGLNPLFARPAEILLVVAGLACPAQAWLGWARVEAALRQKKPLPAPALAPVLTVILTIAGALLLAGMLLP